MIFISIGIVCLIIVAVRWIVKQQRRRQRLVDDKQYNHAIVIGGSISGMTCAAYLIKHFKKVTIIESDDVLNDTLLYSSAEELLNARCFLNNSISLGRSNVNHSFQIHVLQGEGRKILFNLFPQLEKKLLIDYNGYLCSLKKHFRLTIGDVLLNENLTDDLSWFCIDRFTLETILRREIVSQYSSEEIQWITNHQVKELIVDQSTNCVLGLRYQSKFDSNCLVDLCGDLVCDCSGRCSSATKWLKQSFNLHLPNDQLHIGIGYVSFVGHRFATGISSLDSLHVGGVAAHAPHHNKGFLTMPIRKIPCEQENSLGLLSNFAIYCINGEYPPHDSYENLLQWVKDHFHSDYYQILQSSELMSPLLSYRGAFDHRKYVERLGKQWPKHFLLLGDAMCSFNPKNGQGMTHACRQARELHFILKDHRSLEHLSWIYNEKASSITEECWLGSTTNDWVVPTLKLVQFNQYGQKHVYRRHSNSSLTLNQPEIPLFMQFLQWYTHWLIHCAATSGELTTAFLHVVFQQKSPFSLLKPKFFLQIVYTSIINYFHLTGKLFQ